MKQHPAIPIIIAVASLAIEVLNAIDFDELEEN